MKTVRTTKLRKNLDAALLAYVKKFEQVHNCDFEFAVVDDLLGTIFTGDNYFDIKEIIYDIDNKLPPNMIFEWQQAETDFLRNNTRKTISLENYAVQGLRYEDLNVSKI